MIEYIQIFNIIKYVIIIMLIQIKNIIHKYFLEECKYATWDRKTINTINEDLKLNKSCDESDK